MLDWFTDYLFQRFQVVKLGQEISRSLPITFGVPQGSILGSTMFLIFFNYLEDNLENSDVIQFADDTVMFVSDISVNEIEIRLNRNMSLIIIKIGHVDNRCCSGNLFVCDCSCLIPAKCKSDATKEAEIAGMSDK